MEIIKIIRERKCKSIEIKFNNQQIERISINEQIPLNEKRIIELMKEKAYQRITIEVEEGKPVSIERIEKKKT